MDTIKDKQKLDALLDRSRPLASGSCDQALMLALTLADGQADQRVLAVGCHADDIEIGCGGTILALTVPGRTSTSRGSCLQRRAREPTKRDPGPRRSSPARAPPTSESTSYVTASPRAWAVVKEIFEGLKDVRPDLCPHRACGPTRMPPGVS